jgi:hypothetical protein
MRQFHCLAVAAGLLTQIAVAHDAVAAEVAVSWTEVQIQVRPQPGTNRSNKSLRLTLGGGSSISERFESSNRRSRGSSSREGHFRSTMARTGNSEGFGTRTQTSWRVGDSKTLVRTSNWPQHSEVVRVTMISDTTCRAEISHHLKSGFREFRKTSTSRGHPVYLSSITVEQVTCMVSI